MNTAEIDNLLASDKSIVGSPQWNRDPQAARVRLTATLMDSHGVVIGGVSVRLSATLHSRPQRGSAVLLFSGGVIQRLNYLPDHSHYNPMRKTVARPARGVMLPSGQTRDYPWVLNRQWPRVPGETADVGQIVNRNLSNYAAAAAFFLSECGIKGSISDPPWEPELIS